jgi:uncharacterized membrane protein
MAGRALVVALVGLLLGAFLVLPAGAQDGRSFHIADVDITAELLPDGRLQVTEERTFSYRGTYRGAFYELPLERGQEVTDFVVSDLGGQRYTPGSCSADGTQQPGAYELETSRRQFRATWCYFTPATDTERTYVISYTVTRAGTRHADASQLYWKWVGEGWDVRTDRLTASVRLPEAATTLTPGEDLLLWAHGPLQGEVGVTSPGVVTTTVSDLPPATFVEVRVVMPPEVLAAAPSDDEEVRADIIEEEQCLAIAADAERARARGEEPVEDCDPDAHLALIGNPLLLVGLVAGGGGWWVLFRRHGKEYDLPPGLADYERELPSDHRPAMVGWLKGWGSTDDSALVGTIMDLAERGHIELRRETRTRERLLRRDKDEEVIVMREISRPDSPWEAMVHSLLFHRVKGERPGEVTDAELKEWVEKNRESAYSWWQSWEKAIEKEAKRLHWIEPKGWVAASVGIGIVLLGAAVAVPLVLRGNLLLAAAVGLLGLWALGASPLMRRRTPEGRVLHHRWNRFGEYIKDFSLINEKTPDYLRLWGKFIVYAVPLGVADQVMRNLDASLSEAEMQQVAGGWYPIAYGSGQPSFARSMAAFSTAIPAGSISSSPSSSGGGGGGFSGGGGGGGGGSGGGAF